LWEGRLRRSAGLSGDGAGSRTGVMERRGWTGAEWGRGGAPFPGGSEGGWPEEKGAGGVARRLPTSESKFHKKNIAGTVTGTGVRGGPRPKPSASAPWTVDCQFAPSAASLAASPSPVCQFCTCASEECTVAALAYQRLIQFTLPVRHVLMQWI
jgi:hypothetical protein